MEVEIDKVETRLDMILQISKSPLDEIEIVAYGTNSRRFQTGNVSSIKAEDIGKQPVNNPLLALQGRMPGVLITQKTGVSGGGITIQIRGKNSISNGNDPLIVIDGVPFSSQLLPNRGASILSYSNEYNTGSSGNILSFLDPSEIETISVLKDADASAIYGSRGANGVMLITTKKGKVGDPKINVNISTGFGKIGKSLI